MSVDITDQGYTVVVEESPNEVTVVAPGAAGALGYYGVFHSDVDQTLAVNTPGAMTLSHTSESNGVSVVSGSRITFAYDGTYDLQFSAQAHHRGGGGNGTALDIWLKKNGQNVAETATRLVVQKNDFLVPAWDFMLTVAAGDYLELFWLVDNADIVLEATAAAGSIPAVPSLIVTVMQVMYNQVGPQGPTGPTGPQGAKGDKGDKGDTGNPGVAATIAVGTTSTLAPGASATVTNSGTSSAAVFDFGIPEGLKGDKGDKGDTGDIGPQGPSGVISVTAPITNSGTSTSAALALATGNGVTTTGGTLAADFGTSSTTVASGDRGLPSGGTTGQVLAKQSGSNYATEWVTPTTDAPVSASYVTLATDGTLTSERVLTAGTGISVTDAGAGSTVTVATSAILPSTVDAKGDLLVGTADNTVARLGVGANDTVLMAASGETAGVAWRSPRLAGGAARPLLTGGAYLDGSTGLVLSGLTLNHASAPDSAALDITGDIDVKVKVTMTDWTPAATQCFAGKWRANALGDSWYFVVLSTGVLRLNWMEGANSRSADSTVATGLTDGSTKWVRVTLDVDNGSSQRVIKFYLSDDGTTWSQLGTTVTQAGATSIFSGDSSLFIGTIRNDTFMLTGTIGRVIIQSAFDTADNTTSLQFDANFETQTADALAFTESSGNAATVTINTTRYTYGVPNAQWSTSNATQALTINTVYYQPFLLTSPAIVDGTQFVVTTGPASSASVRTGIYAADANLQPTGAPILDAGNTTVGTSATGTFFTQVTPVTLQPGMYVTAINTSVALTVRVVRGGIVGADAGAGTSSIISLMSGAQTQGALPNPGTAWNTRTFSTTGPNHMLFLRWRAV